MDNLSELSKPVAWIIGEESIEDFKRGYETFVVRGDDVDSTEETMKLYSQEYVSALLAEMEAKTKHISDMEHVVAAAKCDDELWDAMAHRLKTLESIRADASQVFKEIGNELGCNPDNESIMTAIDELKKREKRVVALAGGNAELWETMAARLEEAEAKLEAKDKRIAELEGSATLLTNQRDLWYGKVQDLEAKLATPVRLKKVDSSNVPYAGDGFNAAVDYCADRVRAAGFTVQGDE